MQPKRLLMMNRFLLLCLLLVATAATAAAQGSIRGTVTDASTGESLPGVNVVIVGSNLGAATGFDGEYAITGVRTGEYSVQATYIGYETKLFTSIRVRDGEATALDIELSEAVLSTEGEVVVVGERPLVDVEQSSSAYRISQEQIEAAPVREVQEVIANEAGVVKDPTGLYIRGGRAEETGFYVDGVSAKDPLAGTGFGLDIGSNAFAEVEVTTGGAGAEIGDVTSGVVAVTTRDGEDDYHGFLAVKRDNFGFNDDWGSTYNEDIVEFNLSGPIVRQRLRFFVSGQVQLSDDFTRRTAVPEQVQSSLVENDFWMPRTDNRWSGVSKLTLLPGRGMKLQASYQRSLTVNQNTRMLQVTGNDDVIRPGFQYAFVLQPDNANTYTHDNNIGYLKWSHVLDESSFYELQLSRLFTRLRADANGRDWRPDNVDSELDPESVVEYPGDLFLGPDGLPIDPDVQFVLPGPGLFNNGGVATRWHDHFAEEITLKGSYTRFFANKDYRLQAGFETKFNDYQWIDIVRPWVGAPLIVDGDTTQSNRLGQSSDIWRVKPLRGALFATNQIRYRGLIANLGGRLEFWAPGKYVDDLIADSVYTIPAPVRESYLDNTLGAFGRRFKLRLLPKVRVSFPVTENRVLFFNYGHSTKLPHPTFLYTGLDPFYQDRSFFADLGNPNLDPEVDISYELGLRSQITANDALTLTAFWRDKYDFITVQDITVRDATGRETTRAFRVNGDFARIRGIEASYLKRIGRWFQGQIVGSYSRATGLSSTNNEALQQFLQQGNIDNTVETPLAWDRPLDLKANVTLSYDRDRPLLGVPGLNRLRLYVSSTFRSGQRYTPVTFVGRETNPFTGEDDWRPIYERDNNPSNRFSALGKPWWWFDLNLQRSIDVFGSDLLFTVEVTNLFNQSNAVIVNAVTGEAYPDVSPAYVRANAEDLRDDRSYDVPLGTRDPRYEDPSTTGLPPFNPARFLPQRQVLVGLSYKF
jgi:outer membrane receptor protein involved in Fe transport